MRLKLLYLLLLIGLLWVAVDLIADQPAASFNKTRNPGSYRISPAALQLHSQLLIADLHADTLLWPRDLLEKSSWGHVDLPRLLAGGVAIQGFGVVTKTPANLNFERNTGDTDRILTLAKASKWPPQTWTSLLERARYQAGLLHDVATRSSGRLMVLRTRADLDVLLARRAKGEAVVGSFLSLEGTHALEGKVENLDLLFAAGFRQVGLAHFFDNEVAGSAHGVKKDGLTALGRQVLARAEELGMAIDLAHASRKTVDEVLSAGRRPILVSHTGVAGTCPGPRNLTDDHLRQIAKRGGLIGIPLFEGATCGRDLEATLRAIDHAKKIAGVDAVALGSDFDGAITAPIDASGLALITEGLLARGYSEEDLGKILGGNVVRFLSATLPPTH